MRSRVTRLDYDLNINHRVDVFDSQQEEFKTRAVLRGFQRDHNMAAEYNTYLYLYLYIYTYIYIYIDIDIFISIYSIFL